MLLAIMVLVVTVFLTEVIAAMVILIMGVVGAVHVIVWADFVKVPVFLTTNIVLTLLNVVREFVVVLLRL